MPDPVVVPDEFFTDLLPRIRDLAELKLVLHVIHLAARKGSRSVTLRELTSADILRSVVGLESPEPAELRLRRTVDRAVVNDSLLRLTVKSPGVESYLLPALSANRRLVEGLSREGDSAELDLAPEAEISIYRPNVFALYEQHIGPLTPLIAERLRDAERSYPRAWIEAAILQAVHYNKRNWRYVDAILKEWEATGAPDGIVGRHP